MITPRGPTPTKIVYEIPNPMIILARFQIPALKSVFRQVQDGYVIKRAQKSRCEEIKGGDIRNFPGLLGFIQRTRFPRRFQIPR